MASRMITTAKFITQAQVVHGDLYDYSEVVYKGTDMKVKIICNMHGAFWQTPHGHKNGQGCPTCGGRRTGKSRRLTTETFIKKAATVHGNRYDYSNVTYVLSQEKVNIICREHGEFLQNPASHLRGDGCRICGQIIARKKYLDKPTIVYFVKIIKGHNIYYKVGITSQTLKARFKDEDALQITLIRAKAFPTGKPAYEYEQRLLKRFRKYKYEGENILKKCGNSELFIHNGEYNG